MTSSTPASSDPIRAIRHYSNEPLPKPGVLVTIDTNFGELVYVRRFQHAGLLRLPDGPVLQRIALMAECCNDTDRRSKHAQSSPFGANESGSPVPRCSDSSDGAHQESRDRPAPAGVPRAAPQPAGDSRSHTSARSRG